MMRSTLAILQSAEFFESKAALGDRTIRNRKALIEHLRAHRRVMTAGSVALFVVVLAVIIASVALALLNPEHINKGLLPYLGGTLFIGLLELGRRILREYHEVTLTLTVAEHSDDETLARFIEALLAARARPRAASGRKLATR